jgi:hypothetical protein
MPTSPGGIPGYDGVVIAASTPQGIDASSANTLLRKRAPRFHSAPRPKPPPDEAPCATPQRVLQFPPTDCPLAEDPSHASWPAGQRMYKSGGHGDVAGRQTLP